MEHRERRDQGGALMSTVDPKHITFMPRTIDALLGRGSCVNVKSFSASDLRWANKGLYRSVQLSQFTLRVGAAKRGSHFITRLEAHDIDAGHWALFGRPADHIAELAHAA
jgi:hypothetical protein